MRQGIQIAVGGGVMGGASLAPDGRGGGEEDCGLDRQVAVGHGTGAHNLRAWAA